MVEEDILGNVFFLFLKMYFSLYLGIERLHSGFNHTMLLDYLCKSIKISFKVTTNFFRNQTDFLNHNKFWIINWVQNTTICWLNWKGNWNFWMKSLIIWKKISKTINCRNYWKFNFEIWMIFQIIFWGLFWNKNKKHLHYWNKAQKDEIDFTASFVGL